MVVLNKFKYEVPETSWYFRKYYVNAVYKELPQESFNPASTTIPCEGLA
jgi:hypothetical protein